MFFAWGPSSSSSSSFFHASLRCFFFVRQLDLWDPVVVGALCTAHWVGRRQEEEEEEGRDALRAAWLMV